MQLPLLNFALHESIRQLHENPFVNVNPAKGLLFVQSGAVGLFAQYSQRLRHLPL
jgi:hypothetical protein